MSKVLFFRNFQKCAYIVTWSPGKACSSYAAPAFSHLSGLDSAAGLGYTFHILGTDSLVAVVV